MSAALDRVIAEQHVRIDSLQKQLAAITDGWIKHHRKLETLCQAVFMMINHPDKPDMSMPVKQHLRDMGYCLNCEQTLCECDDD